jgi:hypothetical protein
MFLRLRLEMLTPFPLTPTYRKSQILSHLQHISNYMLHFDSKENHAIKEEVNSVV